MRSAFRHVAPLRRCRDVLVCGSVCLLIATACGDSEPEPIESGLESVANHEGRPRDGSRAPLDVSETPDTAPLDDSETLDGAPLDASGTATPSAPRIAPATRTRVPGIDPFSHPTMPLEELERFVAAVETLDRDAECPPPAIPDSLDDHVEVFRIADSCMHIEYQPLNGRTIEQARREIKQADPTVHAVSLPSNDYVLVKLIAQITDIDPDRNWHIQALSVAELHDGWPSNQDDQVTIAVVDTGVYQDHELLDSRVSIEALDNNGGNCHVSPDPNQRQNARSHGTHVAGIAAAENGLPQQQVTGIAPNATILPIRYLFPGSICRPHVPTLAAVIALVWNDSDIINMSLSTIDPGDRIRTNMRAIAADEAALQAAAMQGVVSIAAVGNCGSAENARLRANRCENNGNIERHRPTFPALFDVVIGVASTERVVSTETGTDTETRADHSSANWTVDIAAPGSAILSTIDPNSTGLRIREAGIDYFDGTSMATPMIAGVVAHMKARFPQASVAQITTALTETAVPGPTGENSNCEPPLHNDEDERSKLCYGHGIVQPLKAINALAALRPSIVYITDETGTNQIARINREGESSVLTGSSDWNWGPSLSPDGTQIVSARGLTSDLWMMDVDGNDERQLTFTTQPEYAPSWSPDGDRIVYFRHESHIKVSPCGFLWRNTCREFVRQPHEIWVMDRDGSNAEMFHSDHNILAPSWTSDGTAILFDLNGDIASLDLVTKQVRILLGDGHNYCPTSSPDSGMIAYSSERSGNQELYVMNADGTNRRRLTDDPAADWCPVWMPDGKSLVFTSDRDGDDEIYIMDLDGTGLRQLTDNDHGDFQPSVTKSGEAAAIIASADLTVQLIDPLPAAVDAAGGSFAALSSSWDHVCSSLESRSALCWGTSADGSESAPAEALTGASAGGGHSCALGSGGAVVCWGGGFLGQTDAPEGSFTAVAAGWDHTCGLNSSGGIECWGSDEHGQASPPSGRFTAVSAGDGHSCALDEAGRITCWGLDDDGQASPPSGRFTAIDTGSAHSCALDEAGAVTCWGANWFGQADTPEGSFVEVAAGYGHTCALDEGGLAFCWGLNNDFQANAPYRVFTTITAGRAHACGLDIHAEVMCWGTIEPHDE